MKKLLTLSLLFVIFIAGCVPTYNTDEEVVPETEDDMEQQRYIIPANSLNEETYRTILPYVPGAARGEIVDRVYNRYDVDEVEQGLIRHSKEVFDPEEYFFQEGQYITEGMISDWLARQPTEEEVREQLEEDENLELEDVQVGMNPPLESLDDADTEEIQQAHEASPRILSYIHEQNYLVRVNENQMGLGGISIALVLKSEYAYQTEIGGPTYYVDIEESDLLEYGQDAANTVISRLREREELAEVPILITLYRENERNAITPGNFVSKGFVESNSNSVSDWESIDESYVLFPSGEAQENHFDHYEMFNGFRRDVLEFFPNYIGVVGTGFYRDNNLTDLKVDMTIEFNGKQEVVGFSQHVSSLIQEQFPNNFDVEINIASPNRQESVIFRRAGEEEASVYIYQ